MPAVNVTINGKVYRLACDEGQEDHLKALAAELDGHVEAFKGTFGEIGDGRLTVMAALTIADQLHDVRRRLKLLDAEIEAARRERAEAVDRLERSQETAAEALTVAAERVERLAASLTIRGT